MRYLWFLFLHNVLSSEDFIPPSLSLQNPSSFGFLGFCFFTKVRAMAGAKFEKHNDTFYMYGLRFNRRALERKLKCVRNCTTSLSDKWK